MRRLTSRVRGGFSTISLLGASIIVLAAAGETMWFAHATTSEGRWAAPTVGIDAGAVVGSAGALVVEEASMTTAPVFKPFVMVRIPLPTGYSSGEVMDVNESNQAVGWMHHDSQNRDHGFFFDPVGGVTILDIDTQQHDAAWAYSISDESTPTIAGAVMWKGNPDYLRACTWDGPTGDLEVPFANGVVSEAFAVAAVSSTTTLSGRYEVSAQSRSVLYDGSLAYPAPGVEGEARGLNTDGKVVGWHMVSSVSHAYTWVPSTTTDIHPSPYDASGALAINDSGYIGGWVDDDGDILPALWTPLTPGVYTVEPFDDAGADATVTALNSEGEMVIMRTDASPGVAIWSKRGSVNHADLLDNVTLMPGASDSLYSARTINDAGWIGGSYLAGGTGNPQPCLIIPYDVDNDGNPDYREILDEDESDANENWLIDWAEHISGEGMRVGLHAPDASTYARAIENTQIIRASVHLRHLYFDSEDPLNFPIEEILDDPTTCHDFTEYLNNWTSDTVKREAIIWLRSSLIDDDSDYDYLPQSSQQRAELLALVQEFSHRYATCIDYLQTGNEVFGGAGGYKFFETDLPGCSQSHSWEGARTFQDLHTDCKGEAADAVLLWLHDQMWSALEGSALAGRPLRMIGPGIPSSIVDSGWDGAGVNRSLMQLPVPWLNERQMYFDLHNHYTTVATGTLVVDRLMDEVEGSSAPWDEVVRAVCLELAPRVSVTAWAVANQDKFGDFVDPECPDPGTNWWDFVLSWRFADFSDDFEIDTLLSTMAAPGGNSAKAFSAACYTTGQLDPSNFMFDMAALRATRICVDYIGNNQGASRYTPVKYDYEAAAEDYNIANFDPHPDECGGCPQQ